MFELNPIPKKRTISGKKIILGMEYKPKTYGWSTSCRSGLLPMTMPISIPSPAPIEKAISVLKNVSSNEFKATFWILLKEDMMVLGRNTDRHSHW
jgi:hypothetical protein